MSAPSLDAQGVRTGGPASVGGTPGNGGPAGTGNARHAHVPSRVSRSSRHPVNRAQYDEAPIGARVADRVTGFMGSWTFIIVQTVIVSIWIGGNVYLLFHFDPYPFILLNLAFSTQAAYAAPLILLASNRAAVRDRLTLEHAASEADIEDRQNQELLEGNAAILRRIEALEETNVELSRTILRIERAILATMPSATTDEDPPSTVSRPTDAERAGG